MSRAGRTLLAIVVVVVVLVVLAGFALPLFLNTSSMRAKVENTLTERLGRKVTIGSMHISVWTGSLVAENATVADDPRFSAAPFLTAGSVRIGVEVLPFLFHREIHVRDFELESPKIQLLRGTDGTWNYSSLSRSSGKQPATTNGGQSSTDLSVGEIAVKNGQITVSEQGSAEETRVYQGVDLQVKKFGMNGSFPFTLKASLPGNGTVNLHGSAGPINQTDASATPFSGQLELKHLDPLAAGLLPASDGVSGMVDDLVLDASWSGQQMHVTKLVVDSPHLTIARTNTPKKTAGPPKKNSFLQNLSVDDAEVKNGAVTITTPGKAGAPVVYQAIQAKLTNLTPTSSSPFQVSAQVPGGGDLQASGKVGPFDQANQASTPVDAHVTLRHVALGTAGVLPPDAGISGTLDLQAQVQSNGQTLRASGKGQVAGIKLARDGTPSAKPLDAQFTIVQDEVAKAGQVQQATLSVGGAALQLAGSYGLGGPATTVDLKVNGNGVPIDAVEAFLPSMGVRLPQGSRLQGGTVTTTLNVTGTTANPVIAGPVQIENTHLAGFNLGAKLGTLSKLTGGQIGGATGSATTVRSLRMDVRDSSAGLETSKIAMDVAGLGTATGDGSVGKSGALHYNMLVKLTALSGGSSTGSSQSGGGLAGGLAGLLSGSGGVGGLAGGVLKRGIPVEVAGTTANPVFLPNVAGLATEAGASAVQGALTGKKGAAAPSAKSLEKALGGLLGKPQ